ncbi:alginate export family protein [Bombella sp. TMW 2.2559]|uniref:Alginate export family protein n=1 Tax=Bombella dulcis TaxID=2967339 RepID=A0ABT3WFV2_9PROT|nr:alginate export family protein [Bombella dulcis]MCX5616513.1 alginate export family protein [Bombella dulcis]
MKHSIFSRTILCTTLLATGLGVSLSTAHADTATGTVSTLNTAQQRSILDRIMHTAPGGCPVNDGKAAPNPYGVWARGDGSETGFGPISQYGTPAGMDSISVPGTGICDRDDPFDSYKHMKLNDSGSIWLSLAGETRLNNWYDRRPVFGAAIDPTTSMKARPFNSGRFAVRNLWSADLHFGQHVRFFGQLINADAGGWRGYSYDGTFRKNLDLQQAFVELSGNAAGGHGGFIFGRQQFLDAPDYMIGNRDVLNVPLSWDGFRIYEHWNRVRFDGFYFINTKNNHTDSFRGGNSLFHDTLDYKTRLYGANVTIAPPDFHFLGEKGYSFINLFYYGYEINGGPAQQTVMYNASALGHTKRNNFGLRWHGEAGPISFSLGGAYQQGTFYQSYNRANHYDKMTRNVNAWSMNGTVDYHFRHVMWHPTIGIQGDAYSGGGARGTTGSVNTYIEPFGVNTNYLDPTNYLTGQNLIDFAPKASFTPTNYLTFQLKLPIYWRYSTGDDTYSIYGRNIFARQFTSGMFNSYNHNSFVGIAPQMSASLRLGPHLTWDHHVVRFLTSHAMHQVGARDATYYQSSLTLTY